MTTSTTNNPGHPGLGGTITLGGMTYSVSAGMITAPAPNLHSAVKEATGLIARELRAHPALSGPTRILQPMPMRFGDSCSVRSIHGDVAIRLCGRATSTFRLGEADLRLFVNSPEARRKQYVETAALALAAQIKLDLDKLDPREEGTRVLILAPQEVSDYSECVLDRAAAVDLDVAVSARADYSLTDLRVALVFAALYGVGRVE